MNSFANPYRQTLDNGLQLRSLSGLQDIERVAAFNGQIHGEGAGMMARTIMRDWPHSRPDYWLYVENPADGTVVASLCLLPWRWRYGDLQLRSAEMGFVGTLEAYRHGGLIRRLNERFSELIARDGFQLSQIQGIPYFYRQLGYEYAIPLEAHWRLELHDLPAEPSADAMACTFRPATLEDLPWLAVQYERTNEALGISALRDEPIWRYLLGPSLGTEVGAEAWIVSREQQPLGYFRIAHTGFGAGLIVCECSPMPIEALHAILHRLRQVARERGKPYLRLHLPFSHPLVRLADCYGLHGDSYAWQLRIPDAVGLLQAIAPRLEQRIAGSPFAGLQRTIQLNLYRTLIELVFEDGRLTTVRAVPPGPWGDLRLPPNLLAPLLFGQRSFAALQAAYPDVGASGDARYLVDLLFPPMEAFLYTTY